MCRPRQDDITRRRAASTGCRCLCQCSSQSVACTPNQNRPRPVPSVPIEQRGAGNDARAAKPRTRTQSRSSPLVPRNSPSSIVSLQPSAISRQSPANDHRQLTTNDYPPHLRPRSLRAFSHLFVAQSPIPLPPRPRTSRRPPGSLLGRKNRPKFLCSSNRAADYNADNVFVLTRHDGLEGDADPSFAFWIS